MAWLWVNQAAAIHNVAPHAALRPPCRQTLQSVECADDKAQMKAVASVRALNCEVMECGGAGRTWSIVQRLVIAVISDAATRPI